MCKPPVNMRNHLLNFITRNKVIPETTLTILFCYQAGVLLTLYGVYTLTKQVSAGWGLINIDRCCFSLGWGVCTKAIKIVSMEVNGNCCVHFLSRPLPPFSSSSECLVMKIERMASLTTSQLLLYRFSKSTWSVIPLIFCILLTQVCHAYQANEQALFNNLFTITDIRSVHCSWTGFSGHKYRLIKCFQRFLIFWDKAGNWEDASLSSG